MEDREKHINQKPDAKYPEPSVPVNDAWANMKDMLDTELPVTTTGMIDRGFSLKSWKFFAGCLILAVLLLVLFYRNSENGSPVGNNFKTSERSDIIEPSTKVKVDRKSVDEVPDLESVNKSQAKGATSELKPTPDDEISSSSNKIKKSRAVNNSDRTYVRKDDFGTHSKIPVAKTAITENGKLLSTSRQRNQSHSNKEHFAQSKNEALTNSAITKSLVDIRQPDGIAQSNVQKANTNNLLIINYLNARNPGFPVNVLKGIFEHVSVPVIPSASSQTASTKRPNFSKILKGVHYGVHWNAAIPTGGYNDYFRTADGKNRFYTSLIPAFWVSKELNSNNEVMLKLSAYQQYFGNNKEINSSVIYLADSVNITQSTALVKVIGMSAALQYNYNISNHWSLGVGVNSFLQQKALLRTQSVHYSYDSLSRPEIVFLPDSLYAIKPGASQWKYFANYHVAGNAEIIYKWNRFQLGVGIVVPFKSITNTSYGNVRPVSGQVSFRLKIK